MRLRQAFLVALLGAACATAHGPGAVSLPSQDELGDHLAARARSALGQSGPFAVGTLRFSPDCSGFVASVYEAEGLPLLRLMGRVAPKETSGVAAAFQVVEAYGVVFGGGGEWPRPGDMVFFRNTFDRNKNGEDAPLTHMGLVERVENGTVTFLHRGREAVSRGVLTLLDPDLAKDPDGRPLNTTLRDKRPHTRNTPALAGQLFMGYGRIDPARVPRDTAARR